MAMFSHMEKNSYFFERLVILYTTFQSFLFRTHFKLLLASKSSERHFPAHRLSLRMVTSAPSPSTHEAHVRESKISKLV